MADLRFDELAETYGAVRPTYPDAVYDAILAAGGREKFEVAADVGCGTGASLEGLQRIARNIVGIEPAPRLRAIAHREYPSVDVRSGDGMATGLEDASIDLVTVATAFHWFERAAALKEFHRILQPGGIFAPYRYDFSVIVGPGHLVLHQHMARYWYKHRAGQLTRYDDTMEMMQDSGLFEDVRKIWLPHRISHTAETFAAYICSTSYATAYMKTLDDPEAYLRAFTDELAEAQPGEFDVAFDIELVTGRKADGP